MILLLQHNTEGCVTESRLELSKNSLLARSFEEERRL